MAIKPKVEPKNVESPFNIDEMFFSKTDLKGIILDGNEVFYRVSKYSPEELIGKPHNIIRHPDMPRVVFKLLWEYIENCKPFAGYVKNLAKDGSYYWVYAVVVPVHENGKKKKYLSIRIKPTSHFLQIVKQLYKKLLEIEKEKGMEASEKELFESLKAMEYKDYKAFMIDTMINELKDKDDLLDKKVDLEKLPENFNFLKDIYSHSSKIKKYFDGIYQKVNDFSLLEKDLENKFGYIYEITDDLSLIALNSSVESYKLGSAGASFFVASSEIKNDSERIGKLINNLKEDMKKLVETAKESSLYINISKLEIYMINYFINEIIEDFGKSSCNAENIISNLIDLMYTLNTTANMNLIIAKQLQDHFKKVVNYIQQIEEMIKKLHYIQLNGLIESARLGEQKFSIIFNQVKELVENTNSLINEINPVIKIAINNASEFEYVSTKVNKEISSISDILKKGNINVKELC